MLTLKPIGTIQSCYKQKFGTPRQPGLAPEAYARVLLNSEIQPELSLKGLEQFSHIWLIWGFHQNSNLSFHAKVHPPRLNGGSIGLFATRTPHRPNPLGLSLVALEKLEVPNVIVIRGGDLVEGSPIYDIKPYLPEVEAIVEAKSGWLPASRDIQITVTVIWSDKAQLGLEKWSKIEPEFDVKKLVEQSLKLDPRPNVYKRKDQNQDLLRKNHAMRIGLADIHFRYLSDTQIEIYEVKL